MRKIIALAFVAAAAVLGFKAYADSQGQSVGNPDSSNMLVVEEGYVVAVPAETVPRLRRRRRMPIRVYYLREQTIIRPMMSPLRRSRIILPRGQAPRPVMVSPPPELLMFR